MSEIKAPTQCPDCKSSIEVFVEPKSRIITHWCNNTACPGRVADMLTYIGDRTILEIDGLGPEMAAKLAQDGYVTNLADLFEFLVDARSVIEKVGEMKFREGMAKRGFMGAAALSMVGAMDRALTLGWDRWFAALGIPMIGLRLGKILAEKLNLTSDSMGVLPSSLQRLATLEVEGIGFHKKAELLKYASDVEFLHLCNRLHAAGVRPRPIAKPLVIDGSPLANVTFVITGELLNFGSRDYITSQLVKLGATPKTGVTKKVSHLIVGSEPGVVKTKKAAELGIQQVDEVWLDQIFSTYGIERVGNAFVLEAAE